MYEAIMNWFFVYLEGGTRIAFSALWLGYVLQDRGTGVRYRGGQGIFRRDSRNAREAPFRVIISVRSVFPHVPARLLLKELP
jgi:hypothetical protein